MLRRQVSGSFVCLSCRLQLRGQAGFQRRPFALSARARNPDSPDADKQRIIDAIAGTDHQAAWPDKPRAAPKTRRPRNHDSFRLRDAEPNEPKQSQEPLADGPEIRKYSYEKLRLADGTLPLDEDNNTVRNRGQRFRVGGEDLPMDILGKPGAAIVMRSRGNAKRFVPPEPVVGEDAESGTDITEALETALDAEDEDSLLNIHELRQTDRTLAEIEFNALGDTLLKGFTKAQLEEYLADSESFPREPVKEELPQVPDPEWVVSRKPWIPDPAEGARERGDIMRGYISKSMSPKQRLVAEILRKRWNISCDSVSGNMGRLEVALRDVEFGLLLRMSWSPSRVSPHAQFAPPQLVPRSGFAISREISLRLEVRSKSLSRGTLSPSERREHGPKSSYRPSTTSCQNQRREPWMPTSSLPNQ